eukprot:TRINITY_DN2643_c1_g2_i1.p1 TRINITY_DN2643_c1_g2~~TRINITY_DN2643_c1_g2_i1.p1  ORF type:complete len:789 (-),score=151.56 TRINITY_DN2643_c1_g2_i1:35-2374(-)
MKVKLIILITILICQAFCVDIFVSQNGNDTATCGSQQEPCATIQYAIDLFETSNIIINSNFTLNQPLQADNKIITLNSTLGLNPTIDARNGLILSSNSTIYFKDLRINANSFLISANQTDIYLNNINIGGSTFDRDLFSISSEYSLEMENVNFLDDLQIDGSFFNGKNCSLMMSTITAKNIFIIGAFPFINLNNGLLSIYKFKTQNIVLSQSPLIRVNNTGFQTINNYAQFSSYNITNIQNSSCLMELVDANLVVDGVSFESIQSNNALFSFQSKSRTQIQIFNSVFNHLTSVPFESDLFSKSNTNLYLMNTVFSSSGLPNDQSLFEFDNAYPVNITFNTVTASELNGPVLSITNISNSKPSKEFLSSFHYIKLTICRFQKNQAKQGAALYIDTEIVPITLVSQYNNYLNNKASLNGGAIYFTSSNNLTSFTSFQDTINNNEAGLNGGALYVENSPPITLGYARFDNNYAKNGGAFYSHNCNVITNVTNFFDNSASVSGGIGYISNSDNSYIGNSNFINSTAGVSGGHMYLSGSFLSIHRSTFKQGFAQNGATIYSGKNSEVLLYNSFASYYYATKGGICYAEQGSSCFLDKANGFIGNASYGGGVYGEANSTIDIDGSSIQTSNALYDGGAIWTEGKLRISNSQINSNKAERFGGAIFIQNTLSASLAIVELKNNYAGEKAGSLYLSNSQIDLFNITTSDKPFQSVFCNASTVEIKDSVFSSFGCSSCKFVGAVTLCKFPLWAWIVIGAGSGLLLIVIISVSVFVYKRKNSGYKEIQN